MDAAPRCSCGNVALPGGLLQWQWSKQHSQDAIRMADDRLQKQEKLLMSFLGKQEDLISLFIESLIRSQEPKDGYDQTTMGKGSKVESSDKPGNLPDQGGILAIPDTVLRSQAVISDVADVSPLASSEHFSVQSSGIILETPQSSVRVRGISGSGPTSPFRHNSLGSLSLAHEEMSLRKGATMANAFKNIGVGATGVGLTFLHWVHWWAHLQEPPRTSRLAMFVSSNRFQFTCVIVILLNTFFMIGLANFMMQNQTEKEPHVYIIAEASFLAFYASELVLKIAVHRLYFLCNDEMFWNIFDIVIVVFSSSVFFAGGQNNRLSFLRMFRILNLSRIFRIFRVIVFLRDLRVMLSCVLNSFVSLFWCFALLALIIVVFAIFYVQSLTRYLVEGQPDGIPLRVQEMIDSRFASVEESMATLYMVAIGGLEWSDMYELLISTGRTNAIVLLFFVGFFHVSIFNIATGLFVDKAMKYSNPDHEIEILQRRRDAMKKVEAVKALCKNLDLDSSGTISRDKFMRGIKNPSIRFAFSLEGLDIRDAEAFFDMLAMVHCTDNVDVDTFVAGCLRMRGLATSIDLQTLGFELKMQNITNQHLNQQIVKTLKQLKSKTDHLPQLGEVEGEFSKVQNTRGAQKIHDLQQPDPHPPVKRSTLVHI